MSRTTILALRKPLPESVIAVVAHVANVAVHDLEIVYGQLVDEQEHRDTCKRVHPALVVMHIDQAVSYLWTPAKRAGYRHILYTDDHRRGEMLYELKVIGLDPD